MGNEVMLKHGSIMRVLTVRDTRVRNSSRFPSPKRRSLPISGMPTHNVDTATSALKPHPKPTRGEKMESLKSAKMMM